jgi:hypothetical protein
MEAPGAITWPTTSQRRPKHPSPPQAGLPRHATDQNESRQEPAADFADAGSGSTPPTTSARQTVQRAGSRRRAIFRGLAPISARLADDSSGPQPEVMGAAVDPPCVRATGNESALVHYPPRHKALWCRRGSTLEVERFNTRDACQSWPAAAVR